MNIRLAEEKDIAALSVIRGIDTASVTHWLDRISGYYNGTHHPQQALAKRVIYVAEDDGRIVGFIAGHLTRRYDCDGELQWIDIITDYRNKGIATMLLQSLFNWFRAEHAKQICVNCAPDNTIAMDFYQKNGAVPLNDHWLIWENIDTKVY